MRDYIIVGVDPSLTRTGVAVIAPDGVVTTGSIKTKPHHSTFEFAQRLSIISESVIGIVRTAAYQHYVRDGSSMYPDARWAMERQSFGSKSGHIDTLWHGWWDLRTELAELFDWVEPVLASPQQRAKAATGSGSADKPAVGAALRTMYPDVVTANDDEDDALALATLLGWGMGELLHLNPTADQLAPLEKIDIPEEWKTP